MWEVVMVVGRTERRRKRRRSKQLRFARYMNRAPKVFNCLKGMRNACVMHAVEQRERRSTRSPLRSPSRAPRAGGPPQAAVATAFTLREWTVHAPVIAIAECLPTIRGSLGRAHAMSRQEHEVPSTLERSGAAPGSAIAGRGNPLTARGRPPGCLAHRPRRSRTRPCRLSVTIRAAHGPPHRAPPHES